MRHTLNIAILAIAATLCSGANAAPPDLENCRYQNGLPIDKIDCDALRRLQQAREAREAEQQRRAAEAYSRARAEQDDTQAKRREQEAQIEAARTERKKEHEARMADLDAKRRADELAEAKADAAAAAREKARKLTCGADYKNPQVGMRIERAQECIAAMQVTAQVNRADGVLTTYVGGGAYFHVMDGRIVAWGRY